MLSLNSVSLRYKVMKTYGGVNVSLHTFVFLVLERGGWSPSSTHFSPRVQLTIGSGQFGSGFGILRTGETLTQPGIEP
jgi:hypothetical protein